MPVSRLEWRIIIDTVLLIVLANGTMLLLWLFLGAMPYSERQGMVTADAPAHASAGIDTLTHEDLHAEPLRKGDKLQ